MKTRRKPGGKLRPQPTPLPEIVPTSPYSERQAARLLRMRQGRVKAEREAGRLPGRWDEGGRRWIYPGSSLLAWLRGDPLREEQP